jgi:hypothetical protein
MAMTPRTRVFWRPFERTNVAIAAAKIYEDNHKHGKTWRESLIEAQRQVLTPDRWRPDAGIKTLPKSELMALLKEGEDYWKNERLNAQTVESALESQEHDRIEDEHPMPPPASVLSQALQVNEAPQGYPDPKLVEDYLRNLVTDGKPEPEPEPELPLARRMRFAIDLLVNEAVGMFRTQLQDSLNIALDKAMEEVQQTVQERINVVKKTGEEPPPAKHKPSVVVIGLNKFQEEAAARDFRDLLELHFIQPHLINNTLRTIVAHKDYVVFNMRYAATNSLAMARSTEGKFLMAANNKSVIDRLLEIAVEHDEAKK